MEVVEKDADLLVVTEGGFGKRTPLAEYSPKRRASQGMATINQKSLPEIGQIAAARVVKDSDDLTLISSNGVILRLKVNKLSRSGRATRGSHIMKLEKGDHVASLARIPAVVGENGTNEENEKPIE
jgi:DNA gyrase subunit A